MEHLNVELGNQLFKRTTVLITIVQLCLATGCAPVASQVGEAAAPALVRSGLREANMPDDQEQLQRLADSPAFRHATHTAGEGLSLGMFDEVNNLAGDVDAGVLGGARAPTSAATHPATVPASHLPGATMLPSLSGGMNGFVKSSVQEAFLAATDPQFKAGEEAMSEAIGEGFVSGMIKVLNAKGPELGDSIRQQLGPIVQELIREQIAPAVRDMLQKQLAPAALQVWKDGAAETLKLTVRPDLQPDVQQNAENISIGAGHGTNKMLMESRWLTSSGELSPKVKLFAWLAGGAVALIMVAMFTLLITLNLLALHFWRQRGNARFEER